MPVSDPISVDAQREEAELRGYLGDSFDLSQLQLWQETVEREYEGCGDEQRFYRSSKGYLYNLTAFAMTGTKIPYLRELASRMPAGSRLLDYGCGIGSDGLLLLEAGYRVEFADFANPSTEYLRWRLDRRGLDAPIYDLDGQVPGGFDAAYAFDVIEHVDEPFEFLAHMEKRAAGVMVNLLASEPGETNLHRELPIAAILGHAARRKLISYTIHHGRSHLVFYSPAPAGRIRVAAQSLRIRARRP